MIKIINLKSDKKEPLHSKPIIYDALTYYKDEYLLNFIFKKFKYISFNINLKILKELNDMLNITLNDNEIKRISDYLQYYKKHSKHININIDKLLFINISIYSFTIKNINYDILLFSFDNQTNNDGYKLIVIDYDLLKKNNVYNEYKNKINGLLNKCSTKTINKYFNPLHFTEKITPAEKLNLIELFINID